ncbi:MAG TPA: hypothetical protein VGE24_06660 [Emticicia sp.]
MTKLTFQEKTNLLLNDPNKRSVRALDSIYNLAYVLSDGKILHEAALNQYAHLFNSLDDYKNLIKGEDFYDSVILYDDIAGYASFGIRPAKINIFLKEKYTIDNTYVDKEGYKPYLFESGSVCFVKNVAHQPKRAFWFENKASFDYYFYHVFDNTH